MAKAKKIVLAYSGGLDTSIMVQWLKERYQAQIVAVAIDLSQGKELTGLKEKAVRTGASKAYVIDARKEFVTDYIWKALKAHAIYEGQYLLGTSLARPLIAQKIVEIARKEKADAVSHGATGKGNDQVRFELTFKALAPDLRIIAPWREWELKSREDEIAYAQERGIPVPVTKAKPYSSDRNVWHMSHEGGILEDPAAAPLENMFELTVSPEKAPNKPQILEVGFEKGIPVSVDGKRLGPLELVEKLNEIGGRHGVGRVDMVENRLVGIKSRGVYECPGATILYSAHQQLESLTLDRRTLEEKERIGPAYASLVYDGRWFTPLREAWDAFVDSTQESVTGSVKLKLYKGNVTPIGRRSPRSLYWEELATFGEETIYNQKDAEGFINLYGLPLKVQALLRRNGKERS